MMRTFIFCCMKGSFRSYLFLNIALVNILKSEVSIKYSNVRTSHSQVHDNNMKKFLCKVDTIHFHRIGIS